MFTKFNYSPEDNNFYVKNTFFDRGDSLYQKSQSEAKACLEKFIRNEGTINGSELKEHWFSIKKADVFLSHSHKDLENVKCFAGWLYEEFGLTSFIDSCAWGYCDDLLRQIDDKYCRFENSSTYNYSLRNYSTSHVHMMLSTALTEMIDKCECVIFYNTPNSISIASEIFKQKNGDSATLSPWIYHELSMTSMLRMNPPDRIQNVYFEHSSMGVAKSELNIEYDVEKLLEEMFVLNDDTLLAWQRGYSVKGNTHIHALEYLYDICGIKRS